MHILWLKTEFLHPVDKGGRIRTYQMLRALSRSHRVTYLTLDDGGAAADAEERAAEYSRDVIRVPFAPPARGTLFFYADLARNLLSSLPYAIAKYRSAAFAHEVRRLAGSVDVVVCDFLSPAVNLAGPLGVPSVLFQHNVEAEIWRRHADVASGFVARAYFRQQWRRMVRFEADACRRFDQVVAVSDQDAAHIRTAYRVEHVTAIPTGVDLDYFHADGSPPPGSSELVFTGSMDWMPNEDAVLWFAEAILPRIHARRPDASLTIVGRNPTPRVIALARRHAAVRVTGTVPDVRPFLRRGAALVVPLRIGGGTRLKIYEAMAMGVPVISTSIGAEGLPLVPGEHFLRADTPEGLADACVGALEDPAGARAMGHQGAQYVHRSFGWDRVSEAFAEICADVVRRSAGSARQRSPE